MHMDFNFNLKYLLNKMRATFLLFIIIFLLGCSNSRNKIEESELKKTDSVNFFMSTDSTQYSYYSDKAQACINEKKYFEAMGFVNRGERFAMDKAMYFLNKASIWGQIPMKEAKDTVFYYLDQAIQLEPKNSFYYFARSRFFNEYGNNVEALKDIEVAIKYSSSDNKTAYVNQRGAYKMMMGDFKGAAKDVEIVAEGNKDNAQFLLTQSMIYNQLDMHKEALVSATKLIELDSNIAQAYVVRGNALHYLKRKDESLRDFYKARDLGDTTAIEYIKRHENKTKQK
jgi:tetratricopeptide (TPR) repeat protein